MACCGDFPAQLPAGARYCPMCGRPVGLPISNDRAILPANLLPREETPRRARSAEWLTSLAFIGVLFLGAYLLVSRSQAGGTVYPAANEVPAVTPAAPLATPTAVLPGYEQLTLDVPAGGSYRLTFGRWPAGTIFQGYFILTSSTVGFRVQKPDGADLVNLAGVGGRYDFAYTTPEAGQYAIIFDNSKQPLSERPLTLVYRAYDLTEQ